MFVAVLERVGTFRGQASFKNWMYAIARYRVADHWRRVYRLPETAAELALALLAAPDPESDDTSRVQPKPDLNRVLGQLSERERQVLIARFQNGQSIAETAAALGLTSSNCKVIQHRALKRAAVIASRL